LFFALLPRLAPRFSEEIPLTPDPSPPRGEGRKKEARLSLLDPRQKAILRNPSPLGGDGQG
jgi:hypothetical protein